jgi:hypothetical protein
MRKYALVLGGLFLALEIEATKLLRRLHWLHDWRMVRLPDGFQTHVVYKCKQCPKSKYICAFV